MSRFNAQQHFTSLQPLFALSKQLRAGTLEARLRELVQMRVSQINGCAYCMDMHGKDARTAGETEQRLYVLPAWREASFYSERERAALAWAEALTRLTARDQSVPDELYEQARAQFDEKELVDLTLVVTLINTWNRINIAARPEVGDYKPGMFN
ncbi:MAG TPA: carboxymuconolactone decarboxylase family protein [Rhodanobacteraceae bacterium]|nr:carboxymuconolactone decarboxylase family protein [Rhodanobacteraceae bacterium]